MQILVGHSFSKSTYVEFFYNSENASQKQINQIVVDFDSNPKIIVPQDFHLEITNLDLDNLFQK